MSAAVCTVIALCTALLTLGLSACVNSAPGAAQSIATPTVLAASPAASAALPRLPAPEALLRSASFADSERFKNGADFDGSSPSAAVSSEGSALRFSPDFALPGPRVMSYAMYAWSLSGYSGPASVGLDWDSAPNEQAQVFLGLANWTTNRWDWLRLSGALNSASLAPLPSHLHSSGALAAVVLVLAPASANDPLLGRIFIGDSDSVQPGDEHFDIDLSGPGTPISPLIYGVNEISSGGAQDAEPALVRYGGNRWTAYNWETNASNAGTDWFNQNDGYISDSEVAGQAVHDNVQAAFDANAAAIVTMPIQGYVAADKNGGGDVNQSPNYLATRFRQNLPAKGGAFQLPPNTNDSFVYQDEFLHWLDVSFPGQLTGATPQILVSLDNEPDLWHSTHVRIQPEALGYDELIDKSIASMLAMRAAVPGTLFLGAVNYGWYGYETLQDAPDKDAHGNFLDYYLDRMKAAETQHGQRLLNVMDVHWYPEAMGNGTRITGDDTSAAVLEARLQAPRSLWDTGYTEDSWIAQWSTQGPVRLLPRLKEKIAAHYPGTKLGITEYNYGAGGHISGGLAEADALGAFGREGLYCACMWPLSGDSSYIYGGLRLYRNYDGAGGRFGDLSQPVAWDDRAGYSAYCANYSADSGRLSILLLNKQDAAKLARVKLNNASVSFSSAEVYTLSSAGGAVPQRQTDLSLPPGGSFNASLPGMSATLLVLKQ